MPSRDSRKRLSQFIGLVVFMIGLFLFLIGGGSLITGSDPGLTLGLVGAGLVVILVIIWFRTSRNP